MATNKEQVEIGKIAKKVNTFDDLIKLIDHIRLEEIVVKGKLLKWNSEKGEQNV